MKFKALKSFSSIRWGNIKVGDMIDLQKDTARQMIDSGMVELTPEMAATLRIQSQEKPVAQKEEAQTIADKVKSKLKLDV